MQTQTIEETLKNIKDGGLIEWGEAGRWYKELVYIRGKFYEKTYMKGERDAFYKLEHLLNVSEDYVKILLNEKTQ